MVTQLSCTVTLYASKQNWTEEFTNLATFSSTASMSAATKRPCNGTKERKGVAGSPEGQGVQGSMRLAQGIVGRVAGANPPACVRGGGGQHEVAPPCPRQRLAESASPPW